MFVFICVFATITVGCGRNYYGYDNHDRLFSSDYKDLLRKHKILFYNNPIYNETLEEEMCLFNRNFCRYPKDGNDFWHSYYEHDSLNNFRGFFSYVKSGAIPKSFDDYIEEIESQVKYNADVYGFSGRSMLFDRDYITFYEYDSVIIFTNSRCKETVYSVKPEYLYDKISIGELNWVDLIGRGRLPRLGKWWKETGFYTADSVDIQLFDSCLEKYNDWWKKYLVICDSVITANALIEKMTLNECMLYFNKDEKVIKEFLGKNIPDEVVCDSSLKQILSNAFEFADMASFVRVPFVLNRREY